MTITYSSTRGSQKNLSFRDVVMIGLAHDRGLFVPDTFPTVTPEELEEWRKLDFTSLAIQVIHKFVSDEDVPFEELKRIVTVSCKAFRVEDVTPVIEMNGHFILELFHGPTFAFKDVALQMLGNFFEYFLSTGSNDGRIAILGATSGDTGSAAIYGLRGKKGVDCVITYPNKRVSEIQERQMITVLDENIHCVAVEEANFDDCQAIVKSCFADKEFREKVKLGAVNSINWCRVLAQTTYYFWSYFRVTDKYPSTTLVNYSVPTGNFGDVLAGYYSKRIGLPVGKLVVATNENDILHRFFTKGEYHLESIVPTISPSMDICVSSNFERYLYHLADDNSTTLVDWMKTFEETKKLTIDGDLLLKAQNDFVSARANTEMTLETIQEYHDKFQYMLCPHSAVGVNAIHQLEMGNVETVALATAHFAKFPSACERVVKPLPESPKELSQLYNMETRTYLCPNDVKKIQEFVVKRIEERTNDTSDKCNAL